MGLSDATDEAIGTVPGWEAMLLIGGDPMV
jgi:hypothetical protein